MPANNDFDCNITLNDTDFLNSQIEYNENSSSKHLSKSLKSNVSNNTLDINRQQASNSQNVTVLNLDTSLTAWGLPDSVLMKYKEKGISNMFTWQVECLGNKNVLEHNSNLVYSAPTSAGKTLVAEILALKTLLEKQKKVIIILPFVSVVREKMFYFQDILSLSGIRVEGFMGSHSPPGGFKAVQLAICTIEKANSIVNKLLAEGTLSDIGAVIIDEIHLLGDSSRGYLLELLLTKLLYMCTKNKDTNMQLIGMSATLSNLNLLSKWLNAELYTTNFRPIPLHEYCLLTGEILDTEFQVVTKIVSSPDLTEDSDNILQLCLETLNKSCSVLIFCPTKNWCENLAQQIAVAFFKLGKSKSIYGQCLRQQLNSNAIAEILEQLKRCPVGLDTVLKKTISFGVAFHHAGLTMDERDIVEGAFRSGALRVLVATSTLSSGVNLPAQRVIIRTPMFHGKPLDSLTYRQMIGRAGRMGKDTSGESILICQKTDKRVAGELMGANLQPIESCLEGAGKLKRAILEVIASGVAVTPEDVNLFTNCTLLAASVNGDLGENNPIEKSVEFLVTNEFIRLQENEQGELKYIATCLAKACLSSSLPPEDGLALFEEIEKARQCFVLDSDLHLLYLVTPYSVCSQWSNLDWMLYLDFWEKLSPSMKRVADLVGVQESFIFNATRGRINISTNKQYHRLQIHRRFYTALALQDLVNEVPLNKVANKYQCSRGMLQSLQQSASMFAGMVTSFCSQLGWKCVEILVSQFQDRLQFGINHELLDLMKLPNLNGPRARALYNAGIETLTDLAAYDVCKLENILLSSVPFESEKERDGETAYDVDQKKKIRGIFITGIQGLTAREAANMLIKDARKYLQLEIGAAVLKWDNTQNTNTQNTNTQNTNIQNTNTQNTNTKNTNTENTNIQNEHITSSSINNNTNSLSYVQECKETKNESKNDLINKSKHIAIDNDRTMQKKIIDINNDIYSKPQLIMRLNNSIRVNKSNKVKFKNCDTVEIPNLKLNNSNTDINTIEVDSKNESLSFIDTSNVESNYMDINITEIESENEDSNKISKENKNVNNEITCIDNFNADWTPIDCEIPSFSFNLSKKSQELKRISIELNKSDVSAKSGSLFDESFNLDSKLCDALDSPMQNSLQNANNVTDKMEDTSFFNNIPNSFNIEINQVSTEANISVLEEDTSDIVETSLSEITDCTTNSVYNSIKKQNDTPRKRNFNSINCKELFNSETPKKKLKYNEKGHISHSKLEQNMKDPIDLTSIDIVDISNNKILFEKFCTEIKTKSIISFAIGCEYKKQEKPLIGQNIINSPRKKHEMINKINEICLCERLITGFAISFGDNTSYYISFIDETYINNFDKLHFIQEILQNKNIRVRIFDYKEHAKILYKLSKIIINSPVEDPKIADWLLEPEGKEKNLTAMAIKYSPEIAGISQLVGNCKGVGSIALDLNSAILSRLRASVEALVTWHIVESQKDMLIEQDIKILNTFETEMKSLSCLVKLELVGLCVDKNKMNKLIATIQEQMAVLQQQAFSYAGRHFSFTSSRDVAKVLGIYNGNKVSTNKRTLEQSENPISKLILQWRKLNCTLTKMMYPILRSLKEDRIHGCCVTHSSTGRISMHEPNLQNVPRNFEIIKLDKTVVPLSARASFVPSRGKIFLSADYCQLELRILADMSQDSVLCTIMKSEEDVFKSIAAKLNKISENEVNDVLRQRAKQLCYGIIYGMGPKALSDQLNTTEEEAIKFSMNFKNTYPKIQQFMQSIIDQCKELGYVQTLAGRRRYLSHINSEHSALKHQAERQAVNTTIQGSAADIAIDQQLLQHFPGHILGESKVSLILHLHDELLYEVPTSDLTSVAKIVKKYMEKSVKLSIPFPVKLKSGFSWGELEELIL